MWWHSLYVVLITKEAEGDRNTRSPKVSLRVFQCSRLKWPHKESSFRKAKQMGGCEEEDSKKKERPRLSSGVEGLQ